MAGWIYDYRQELESNIWAMPPMYHRVWQWIKYNVNHSENKIPNRDGTFTIIKPGQRATSYRQIAKGVGYYEGLKWKEPNAKTIKYILDWMVANEMITISGNSQGTVITIEKWALYQKELPKGNTKETPRKHSVDTNNKGLMNEELMSNKKHIADIDEIRKNLPKDMAKVSKSKSKLKDAIERYGKIKIIDAIKKYEKEVLERRNKGFKELQFMNESTFWNGRYLDYLQEEQEQQKPKRKIVQMTQEEYEVFLNEQGCNKAN